MFVRWLAALVVLLVMAYGLFFLYCVSPLFNGEITEAVTVTTDQEHPGYVFYLVNWSGNSSVERVRLSPTEPARFIPDNRTGAFRQWSFYAVPAELLTPPDGSEPTDCKWFMHPRRENAVRWIGEFEFGGHFLPFYDNRDRIETHYLVSPWPGRWRMVIVAENVGDPHTRRARIGAVALAVVGLVGLWLWCTLYWTKGLRPPGPADTTIRGDAMPDPAAEALSDELTAAFGRIAHCVGQLTDEQVWHRPRPDMNSVGNLLLHLAGNLRYFFAHGIGGAADVRDRPAEFAARGPTPGKDELLALLQQAVAVAVTVLQDTPPEELGRVRRLHQGDITGYRAAVWSVAHLRGHTQEIIHMTRTMLGDGYRFAGQR